MSVLAPGSRIQIHGITGRPELNGRIGSLARYVRSKARWEVLLDGEVEGFAPLGLRPGNLKPLWDCEGADCAVCLAPLDAMEGTEQLLCSHSFHRDCIEEMRNCGAMDVCGCCRRAHADLRSVQWLVDEAATLIVRTNRASLEPKQSKLLASYTTELLIEASQATADDGTACINLGTALEQIGDVDTAIAVYRAAIEHNPGEAELYVSLGAVLGQKNDIDGAIEAYSKAVDVSPSDAKSHCSLGVMFSMKGDSAAAVNAFRAACNADPSDAAAHCSLGEMLAGEGDFEGATSAFLLGIKADPSDPEMHCRLGDVRRTTGDVDGAIFAFQAAVQIDPSIGNAKQQLEELLGWNRKDGDPRVPSAQASARTSECLMPADRRREIERRRRELKNQQSDVELS